MGGREKPEVLAAEPEETIDCFNFPDEVVGMDAVATVVVTMATSRVTMVTSGVTNPLLPPLLSP